MRKENIKKVTQELLQEVTFKVNNLVQNEKTGSAAERFFRRKPKDMLPNTMEREVDRKNVLEERGNEQTKIATKRKEELIKVPGWRESNTSGDSSWRQVL